MPEQKHPLKQNALTTHKPHEKEKADIIWYCREGGEGWVYLLVFSVYVCIYLWYISRPGADHLVVEGTGLVLALRCSRASSSAALRAAETRTLMRYLSLNGSSETAPVEPTRLGK